MPIYGEGLTVTPGGVSQGTVPGTTAGSTDSQTVLNELYQQIVSQYLTNIDPADTARRARYEDMLKNAAPLPGEDIDAYVERLKAFDSKMGMGGTTYKLDLTKGVEGFINAAKNRLGRLSTPGAGGEGAGKMGGGGPRTPGAAGAGDDWQQKIKMFYDEMMKPVDLKDPYFQRILQMGRTGGMSSALDRGVEGGLTNAAATQTGTLALSDAAAQETARRQGLGMQALGLGSGNALGLSQLRQQGDLGWAGLGLQAKELQYQADLNSAMYNQQRANNNPMMAGLMGGMSGAAAGAPLGWMGMAAGAALGGLGGYYGASTQQPVKPPSGSFTSGIKNA